MCKVGTERVQSRHCSSTSWPFQSMQWHSHVPETCDKLDTLVNAIHLLCYRTLNTSEIRCRLYVNCSLLNNNDNFLLRKSVNIVLIIIAMRAKCAWLKLQTQISHMPKHLQFHSFARGFWSHKTATYYVCVSNDSNARMNNKQINRPLNLF